MPTPSGRSNSPLIILLLVLEFGILLAVMWMPSNTTQAVGEEYACYFALTPTKTGKPEKVTITPTPIDFSRKRGVPRPATSRLCGELVFFTGSLAGYNQPTVAVMGLIPCGRSAPYILSQRPRDIVRFYQFRDPKISSGKMIFTEKYGCLDTYITGFKNYIGLESCADCGKSSAPTWTQVPLTPYTFTPIPPTRTPWPTPVTPTLTRTLSPEEVTPTLSLFELLQGTFTPTSSALPTPSEAPALRVTESPPGIAEATPGPSEPFYQRYWPLGLLLFAVLIFLIPLITVLRDILREGRQKR